MSIFEISNFLGLAGYYRRFENGLKFFIRGRIVGLRLQNMDSMVGTTLTIEREIEDARSTQDAGVGSKREVNLLLVWGKGRRLLLHTSFRTRARIGHVRWDYPQ